MNCAPPGQDLSLVYALIALLIGIIVGWAVPKDPP
ncbi:hypothetical protein WYO_3724 [Methylobacterium sp. GXF4]|nr:hypothetical protein WYO_3724 [Methylobacterium sp. GXF4]